MSNAESFEDARKRVKTPSLATGMAGSLLLLLALLSGGCHTTVYRSESQTVRIVVVRRAPSSSRPVDRTSPPMDVPEANAPEGPGDEELERPGARP